MSRRCLTAIVRMPVTVVHSGRLGRMSLQQSTFDIGRSFISTANHQHQQLEVPGPPKDFKRRTAVVLIHPQIPGNTGNAGRTCVGFDCELHLIRPEFSLDDKDVKRAGLDYWPKLDLHVHSSWEVFAKDVLPQFEHIVLLSKANKLGERCIFEHQFDCSNIALIFGNETQGVPPEVAPQLDHHASLHRLFYPMNDNIRSYNLANVVAMTVADVMKQRYLRQ